MQGTTRRGPRPPLGNNLRLAREAAHVSLREVARAVGIDPGDLSRIEREQKGCGDSVKAALAAYYGLPIDWLFFQPVTRTG